MMNSSPARCVKNNWGTDSVRCNKNGGCWCPSISSNTKLCNDILTECKESSETSDSDCDTLITAISKLKDNCTPTFTGWESLDHCTSSSDSYNDWNCFSSIILKESFGKVAPDNWSSLKGEHRLYDFVNNEVSYKDGTSTACKKLVDGCNYILPQNKPDYTTPVINQCVPDKTCNVCDACCQPYLAHQTDCDNCVKSTCPTP